MLQTIRNNTQGPMAKVIIAIIIVPFAIFGVESLISIGGGDVAAEVNGEEIHPNEVARAVNSQQQRLLAQMGENIDPATLDESRLKGPVLDLLIDQRLLIQHADKLGMSVPDQLVDRVIVSAPEFREGDRFSPERYRAILANQGYTPAWFKNEVVRKEMLIGQLQRGLLLSEFATGTEVDQLAALAAQKRSYEWLQVPAVSANPSSVGEEAVEAFYEANGEQFLQPERVRLAYVELKSEDFANAEVDEAAVRAEYEREVGEAATAAQREVAHILIDTPGDAGRAEVEQLAEQLSQGADFSELAAEHSDDPGSRSAGGYLGFTTGSTFPEPFEAAAANLAVGEVSEPVETEAGWHLVKVLSEQQSEAPSFDERRDEIARQLASAQAQPELMKAVERMRDLTFNADDLADPAAAVDAQVQQSNWLTRDNDHPVLGHPAVIAAAFGEEVLREGHNSDAIELAPDHFVFVRVREHQEAQPLPLAEVRDEIAQRLAEQEALVATRARARELLGQAREGDIAQVASEANVRHGRVEDALRTAESPLPGLTPAVFGLPKPTENAVHDVVELDDGSVAIVALRSVEPGSAEGLSAAERDAWRRQLAMGEGQNMFMALLHHLRASAEIERF